MVAFRPLVTAHNCVCSLIRICCNTTRYELQRERGTTTSVQTRMTSCAFLVVWSPTRNAPDMHKKERPRAILGHMGQTGNFEGL